MTPSARAENLHRRAALAADSRSCRLSSIKCENLARHRPKCPREATAPRQASICSSAIAVGARNSGGLASLRRVLAWPLARNL